MNGSTSSEYHDLVFVGSGASASYTLLALLEALETAPGRTPFRLAVVERAPDQFGGLPYGSRSGSTSLIITSLRDFLPEPEIGRFRRWLTVNKETVFEPFRSAGGSLSHAWWDRHAEEIADDRWDELFLPRYVFGAYLRDRLGEAIERAHERGVADVELVHDEVVDIVPADGGYLLVGREYSLRSHEVVLTVGTPPTLGRLGRAEDDAVAPVCLIDDPFEPSIQANVAEVVRMASEPGDGSPLRICIIGGNASTMELIYQFADHAVGRLAEAGITVLTLRGSLPERLVAVDPTASFDPRSLEALRGRDGVSGRSIFEAAVDDIDRGHSAGLTVSDMLGVMGPLVAELVRGLDRDEAEEWAGRWGMELGRYQRRAGHEYCDVVDALLASGRLRLVEGRFSRSTTGDDGVTVGYVETSGDPTVFPEPFDVVINCGGFATLPAVSPGSLLANLFASGLIATTRWDRGIAVDDDFAAAPGIFVMGPLLAGNVMTSGAIWHMEHCGRIVGYGTTLGSALAERLVSS